MGLGNINGQELRGMGTVLCEIGDAVLIHADPQVRFLLTSTEAANPSGTVDDGVVVIKVGGLTSTTAQSGRVSVELTKDRSLKVVYLAQPFQAGTWQLTYTFIEE